ncbi:MAG: hypothetical protein ACRD3B_12200, partial [Candidatus Sulfotelmatobacter sp.]
MVTRSFSYDDLFSTTFLGQYVQRIARTYYWPAVASMRQAGSVLWLTAPGTSMGAEVCIGA